MRLKLHATVAQADTAVKAFATEQLDHAANSCRTSELNIRLWNSFVSTTVAMKFRSFVRDVSLGSQIVAMGYKDVIKINIISDWLRAISGAFLIASMTPGAASAQNDVDVQALVTRTKPGAGQAQLRPLLGRWRVAKENYLLGAAGKPLTSEHMTTVRTMIGDGRFLSDTTRGVLGGRPYFRTGTLGYNNIARRYEFVTADNITPLLMSYQGHDGTAPASRIDMFGTFADPGVMGERNVGKIVAMRTEIRIIDNDHHEIDLYFTGAGQPERLVDKMTYTRMKIGKRR